MSNPLPEYTVGRLRRKVLLKDMYLVSIERTNPLCCVSTDVDECAALESPCGPHGFCENTEGRYRCACDQGYQEVQDGRYCEGG